MYAILLSYFEFNTMSDESPLGRYNNSCMSLQTMMEILVSDIEDKDFFTSNDGTFADYTEWEGIECIQGTSNVLRIEWSLDFIGGGTIDLQWVPHTVQYIDLFGSLLKILNFCMLPPCMKKFNFGNNEANGELANFLPYPQNLRSVRLQDNFLTGPVDFRHFPENLRVFDADGNYLRGTLHLGNLHAPIKEVGLANNNFEGMIFFDSLPESLLELRVGGNKFSNEICCKTLQQKLAMNAMREI